MYYVCQKGVKKVMLRNAFAYITRKKKRSVLLIMIFTLVLTLLNVCINIKRSNDTLEKSLYTVSNSSLSITSKTDEVFDYRAIKELKHYTHVYQYTMITPLEKLKAVSGNQTVMREDLSDEYKNSVTLEATNMTSKNDLFHSEAFKLIKGLHLKEKDLNKALIHEDFAKKNHLKLGDRIGLQSKQYEIIGIFSGRKQETYTGLTSDFSENTIFVDYASQHTHRVNRILLFSKTPKECNSVEKQLSKYSSFQIEKNMQAYEESLSSIQNVKHILSIMIYAILMGGIIVLSLILILWFRERIYEIGILLSIGKGKLEIISQFILELMLLSIPSTILSLAITRIMIQLHMLCCIESYIVLIVIILLSTICSCGTILIKKPKKILTKIS